MSWTGRGRSIKPIRGVQGAWNKGAPLVVPKAAEKALRSSLGWGRLQPYKRNPGTRLQADHIT